MGPQNLVVLVLVYHTNTTCCGDLNTKSLGKNLMPCLLSRVVRTLAF
jgi:hypothetical protein